MSIHNAGGKLSTTSGRTTNTKQFAWVETNKRKSIVKRRESSNINEYKGTRAKGQVVDNLREGNFKELYDVIVRFPEPRVRSQYAQEIATFS